MNKKVVVFLFLFITVVGIAQPPRKSIFEAELPENNLHFTSPQNYITICDSLYGPEDGLIFGSFSCLRILKHKKRDILICLKVFSIYPPNKATHDAIFKNTPDYQINIYKYGLVAGKDTLSGPFINNDPKLLKATFSHKSMEGDIYLLKPFMDKYTKAKGVIIQRNWIGLGIIYYFYNETSSRYIGSEIKRTSSQIFKFLPDEQFNPGKPRAGFIHYYPREVLEKEHFFEVFPSFKN